MMTVIAVLLTVGVLALMYWIRHDARHKHAKEALAIAQAKAECDSLSAECEELQASLDRAKKDLADLDVATLDGYFDAIAREQEDGNFNPLARKVEEMLARHGGALQQACTLLVDQSLAELGPENNRDLLRRAHRFACLGVGISATSDEMNRWGERALEIEDMARQQGLSLKPLPRLLLQQQGQPS